MADYVSVHQVQEDLNRSLCKSFAGVKEAYEVWMNAAVDLPEHMLPPAAVEANELIHAALRAAPRGTEPSTSDKLTWMLQYLPEINTAMHDALSIQMDISAKRISALQSPSQGTMDGQSSSQVLTERDTHVLLEIQVWAYLCTHALAVLAAALLSASKNGWFNGGGGRVRGCTRRQRLQRDKQLGDELCYSLGLSLHNGGQKATPLRRQNLQNKANLNTLDVLSIGASIDKGHFSAWLMARFVGYDAAYRLCGIASKIPCTFVGGNLVKQAMTMATYAYETAEYDKPAEFRSLICKMLADGKLRPAVAGCIPEDAGLTLASVIPVFEIRAKHLREAGIPEAAHQHVLADWGGSKDCLDWTSTPDEEWVEICDRFSSDTQNHGQAVGDSAGRDAGTSAGGGAGGELKDGRGKAAGTSAGGGNNEIEDADDMHTLLRLMYGCGVSEEA